MEVGSVVWSTAGHDKERFYMVVKLEGAFAFIADGKERKLEAPKKKNKKHLPSTCAKLEFEKLKTNRQLIAALKPFMDRAKAEF